MPIFDLVIRDEHCYFSAEDDVELVPLFTTCNHIFFLRLLQILESKADIRNFSVFYFSFFEETDVLHQGYKRFEVVEIP